MYAPLPRVQDGGMTLWMPSSTAHSSHVRGGIPHLTLALEEQEVQCFHQFVPAGDFG